MIAREQQIGLLERESHVVCGVAGRRDRLDGEAPAGNDLAVGQRAIGPELGVVAGIEARRLADIEGTRGAVRSFGQNQGPGRRLDPGDRGGMIAVSVRHENMGDGFTAHGVEQGGDVRLVERPGIDDRDLAAADDVGHRSFEREWSGIVGEYPPHARRGLRHGFGRQVEAPVEGNVVAHVDRP